jgi:hypothetical protein
MMSSHMMSWGQRGIGPGVWAASDGSSFAGGEFGVVIVMSAVLTAISLRITIVEYLNASVPV